MSLRWTSQRREPHVINSHVRKRRGVRILRSAAQITARARQQHRPDPRQKRSRFAREAPRTAHHQFARAKTPRGADPPIRRADHGTSATAASPRSSAEAKPLRTRSAENRASSIRTRENAEGCGSPDPPRGSRHVRDSSIPPIFGRSGAASHAKRREPRIINSHARKRRGVRILRSAARITARARQQHRPDPRQKRIRAHAKRREPHIINSHARKRRGVRILRSAARITARARQQHRPDLRQKRSRAHAKRREPHIINSHARNRRGVRILRSAARITAHARQQHRPDPRQKRIRALNRKRSGRTPAASLFIIPIRASRSVRFAPTITTCRNPRPPSSSSAIRA